MDYKIVESFRNGIISDEIISVAKDFSEIAFDSFLNDGTLKDIPFFGSLLSIYKIGASLNEKRIIKKIAVFLAQLSDISLNDRKMFLDKLSEDDKYKESVFEKVLFLIEKLDETAKAEIMGNLFKLYIMEVLSKEQFFRFSSIVSRALLYDLLALHYTYSWFRKDWDGKMPYHFNIEVEHALLTLGLMSYKVVEKDSGLCRSLGMSVTINKPVLEFEITKLGQDLSDFMFFDLQNKDFIKHIDEYKIELKSKK